MVLILINLSTAQQLDLFYDKFDGRFSKMRSKFMQLFVLKVN